MVDWRDSNELKLLMNIVLEPSQKEAAVSLG